MLWGIVEMVLDMVLLEGFWRCSEDSPGDSSGDSNVWTVRMLCLETVLETVLEFFLARSLRSLAPRERIS